jgi:carboxyl-terminal processing protease
LPDRRVRHSFAAMRLLLILTALLPFAGAAHAQAPAPEAFREDALSIETLVNSRYAYLDRFPGGVMPMSDALRAEAAVVHDRPSLLRYAEHALTALADPHAITGSSFNDSWALTPSYSDLWIERQGEVWRITAVREGSPAEAAGVRAGQTLDAVGDLTTTGAVRAFWAELGLEPGGDRDGYAARVLAAGRRDRDRDLTVSGQRMRPPNLYAERADRAPLTVSETGGALVIRFNDSLGDSDTVAAFDAVMAGARAGQPILIDLTDTASGGNTVVARAVMGWFVTEARPYQIHNLPSEERQTGVPRQWVEQVLPRSGKYRDGPVTVRVGRWTGSMGEGLAIGFDALGARVEGDRMAGLLGAVYDLRLENSGLVIKIPAERLYAVDGTPREAFDPRP